MWSNTDIKREKNFSNKYIHTYLPEKKMPSTQAKAMILSAKELSLQKNGGLRFF